MKAKQKTKNFSTRCETSLLESFDSIVEKIGKSRNNVINDLILNYIAENSKSHIDFDPIPIADNKENLGYVKSFFIREDAEFFMKGIEVINEGSLYNFPFDKEEEINRLISTGVKYSFNKIGIYIYTAWYFDENRDSDNRPILDLNFSQCVYDQNNDLFYESHDFDYLHFPSL